MQNEKRTIYYDYEDIADALEQGGRFVKPKRKLDQSILMRIFNFLFGLSNKVKCA